MTALSAPNLSGSSLFHFFEYQSLRLRTQWRGLVVTGVFSPLLFLLVIGVGLGELVDSGDSDLGTSYLSYIGPGLLATAAMQWGATQALWPTMAELKWEGGYRAALVTPLTVDELAAGHIGWISFQFFLASVMFCGVLASFGVAESWWFLLTPLAATLTCAAFAAAVVAFSSVQKDENLFPLVQRFMVIPLLLFSGAFFPVSDLPIVLAWMARFSPSWHGVELCRGLTLGSISAAQAAGHISYCAIFVVAGWYGTRAGIRKTLAA